MVSGSVQALVCEGIYCIVSLKRYGQCPGHVPALTSTSTSSARMCICKSHHHESYGNSKCIDSCPFTRRY
eukprot:3433321-Amphidinium_carterae.1